MNIAAGFGCWMGAYYAWRVAEPTWDTNKNSLAGNAMFILILVGFMELLKALSGL